MLTTLRAKLSRHLYTKAACFVANVGSVHALAISHDGQILASGG